MVESQGFKFSCPRCGQRLEAELDMVGITIGCPGCGQPLKVPSLSSECQADVVSDAKAEVETTTDDGGPKIAVLKRRESFTGRWKKRLKAIGIGIALLCLFAGVGIMVQITTDDGDATETVGGRNENPGGRKETSRPFASANKKVLSSVECLLDFMKLPNERRLRVLVDSLQGGPDDFKDAVSEYLVSFSKNPEDFISSKEKEDAVTGTVGAAVLLGILGAACTGDSQGGVNAGLQLGDMEYAKLQEKARSRLREEIEKKRNRLIEVAQTYGIDSNAFEEALVSRER